MFRLDGAVTGSVATWLLALALQFVPAPVLAARSLCVVVSGIGDATANAIADDVAAGLRARVEPEALEVRRCDGQALADWHVTLALGTQVLSVLVADASVVMLERDVAQARRAPRKASRTAVLLVAEALRPAIAVRPAEEPSENEPLEIEEPDHGEPTRDASPVAPADTVAAMDGDTGFALHARLTAGGRFGLSPSDVAPAAGVGIGAARAGLLLFVGIDAALVGPAERDDVRATGVAFGVGPRVGLRGPVAEAVLGPSARIIVLGLDGANPLLERDRRTAVGLALTASGAVWPWRRGSWRLGLAATLDAVLVGQRFLVDNRPILETSTLQVLVGPQVTWDAGDAN